MAKPDNKEKAIKDVEDQLNAQDSYVPARFRQLFGYALRQRELVLDLTESLKDAESFLKRDYSAEIAGGIMRRVALAIAKAEATQ